MICKYFNVKNQLYSSIDSIPAVKKFVDLLYKDAFDMSKKAKHSLVGSFFFLKYFLLLPSIAYNKTSAHNSQ